MQPHDSYEIVICDNCSSPATRHVVDSFDARLIHYVRSDRPLAMAENWELAVSHARGEYVIVIGDDDALLPDALSDIDRILLNTGTRVLRWERVYYSWPDILVSEEANMIHIPLTKKSEILDGRTLIQAVANFETDYTLLPMLYNSAIHSDMIRDLKSKISRVFAARSPDVFSGFAFAYLAGSYISIGRPMSINAGSAKSNGVAHMHLQGVSPVAQEFRLLTTNAGLLCHPRVPDIIAMPAELANSFQHAKDLLFPNDLSLCLDRKRLVVNCLNWVSQQKVTAGTWKKYLREIRRSLVDDESLLAWFEMNYASYRPTADIGARGTCVAAPRTGFDGNTLHLNAADFGVTDVMGAAQLSSKILGKMQQLPPLEESRLSPYRRLRTAARILLRGY